MKLVIQKVHNGKVAVEITQTVVSFADYVAFLDNCGIVADESIESKTDFAQALSLNKTETYRIPLVTGD